MAAGCTNTTVTEYGADAKKNFVTACTADTAASNGTTTTSELASTNYCECVYAAISDKNSGFDFDALQTYEEQLSDASPDNVPAPPAKLRKAMDGCPKAGPSTK